jgi:hypothetical protein
MAILMCHMDLTGSFYYTSMVEKPRIEYNTIEECQSAAAIKRKDMLRSSLNYSDLEIFDVIIDCKVDVHSEDDGISIPI